MDLRFSQPFWMVYGHFLGYIDYIERGPDMLYMVGKTCLYGICFNIVHNELGHKNMNIFEYLIFQRDQEKNINLFKTKMMGHETATFCHTHIYLSNRILQTEIIS